jgi:DNA-binding MarR family transcriptional regulator
LYIQILYMQELGDILQTETTIPTHKSFIIHIMLMSIKFKDELNKELKTFDLSLEQFNVLRILRGQKEVALNMQDIQERMINKMSNTTRLIDKLLVKELVSRKVCKANRRKIEVQITTEGIKLLDKVSPKIEEREQNILGKISENEQKQVINILKQL